MPQVALLLQEEATSRAPLWLQVVREAGQAFQAWVTPFLLAAGGLFAYYRFRRSRTAPSSGFPTPDTAPSA